MKEANQGCIVSAIITTHNRLDLLKRAIDSVKAQTYPCIECIVVSDGSTDGTVEYCNSREDIKFIDIRPENSRGGNHARNLGIKAAAGEYIAFLDDDDCWLPEKIERQVTLIEETGYGLVSCERRVERIHADGTIEYYEDGFGRIPSEDVHTHILYKIVTLTSMLMVRKTILEHCGLFDEKLHFWQEYELTIRLAQQTLFCSVTAPLVIYRIDEKDSGRLTNKFYGWKESVQYIYRKHANLYARLSVREKLEVKYLFYNDARVRATLSGDARLIRKYNFRSTWFRRFLRVWDIVFMEHGRWVY